MKCIEWWFRVGLLSVFVTIVLLSSTAAAAVCPSDVDPDVAAGFDQRNANVALNDYALLFQDTMTADTACQQGARDKLLQKLKNIFGIDDPALLDTQPIKTHSDLLGRGNTPPFQGWLEGANGTMVFVLAYRLNFLNLLDNDLARYVDKVADLLAATAVPTGVQPPATTSAFITQPFIALSSLETDPAHPEKGVVCGLDVQHGWSDECMDDYSVASAGIAWAAAYGRLRGKDVQEKVSKANLLINETFSDRASVCLVFKDTINPSLHEPAHSAGDPNSGDPQPVGSNQRGPCQATPADVLSGAAVVFAQNHGPENPAYGFGLMTSTSTALVALRLANADHGFLEYERIIAKGLLDAGQRVTNGNQFTLTGCYGFNPTPDKMFFTYDNLRSCAADLPPYYPDMFPLREFYFDLIGFGVAEPLPLAFNSGRFPKDDNNVENGFFGAGREFYYGSLGWDNRPGLLGLLVHVPSRRRAVSHSAPAALVSNAYNFSVLDPAADVEIPLSYQVNGTLPPGITFSGVTGMLSGTAAPSPGVFDFAVTAVYVDGGTLPQEYALPVCQSTFASPNVVVNVAVNSFFATTPLNSNPLHLLTYDTVAGGLPPGAFLDENTGAVSGAANMPGTYIARLRSTLRPSGTVQLAACPAGTTTDIFYQIAVGCGAGCQPQYEGYNDGLDIDNVWGWAWDKSFPTSPIQVDIYDSGFDVVPAGTPLLARVNANLFRQDLLDAGKGDGNHAFVLPVPDALKDGNAHRIHVTFAGTKIDLSWSPRILVASSGRFVGAHSTNACDRIDGFALDNWQRNTPIDVNIFDNGALLASLVANYDSTVVPATAGNGTHGFLYYTPDRLKDGNSHQITITFKLSGQQLSATNRTLSCPATPPPSMPVWEGFFDSVTCDRVDGWGWDANRPNTPVDTALLADGIQVATLTANYFSQELVDAGKGNGAHRFLYYLPDFLKDGGQHHVTAQIIGQGTDLPVSSPNTNGNITCAALPAPVHPPFHPITNTSAGPSSTASSGPATGTTPGVDVTFNSVSVAGVTSFIPVDPATLPQLPDGYAYPHAAINPATFDISTTAGYSGPVSVTFTLPTETDPIEFSLLRILHLEGGVWQDRTSLPSDMSTHKVTALVGSFSPFVVARLIQRPVITSMGITSSGSSVYGQSVGLTARVYGLGNGTVPTGTVTFLDGSQVLGTVQVDSSSQAALSTTLINAGTRFITASYSGDFVFPASSAQVIQVVTPAAMSVSVASSSRQYGATNPALSGTFSGLQNNDNITATFQSAATASSPVGPYAITAVLSDPGSKLSNYTVAIQNGVLSVTPVPLSVSINPATRFYGDPNPEFTGTVSGLQNSDNITVAYQTSATASSNAGTYSITATLSDPGGRLGNYSVSQGSGTLTVQAASLQVTANNKTRMYGAPNPVLDGTITGIRNADNIQAQYSTTATPQSLVGNYLITPALSDPNGRLGNYTVTLQNGTLTVTRSNIALAAPTFSPASGTYPPGTLITMTEATSSAAAIHYTIDGSTPTASSPLYTGSLVLNATRFFKAMATQPEYLDSAIGSASYSIQMSVSASPSSQPLVGCASVNYTVSVPSQSNVSGTVSLSVSGLPAGATASFNPATINNFGSSTLTVSTSTSTPTGTYPLTITVSNAPLTGSTNVNLVVQDFNLAAASSSQTVTAGGGATYSLSGLIVNGFAGSVGLTSSGLPAGTSATFSPTSFTGAGASTLNVVTSTSTPAGTYTLTAIGTSGCRTHSLPLTLIVNAPPPTGPAISSLSISAGPVGTPVTINGVNFGATQSTSTVAFNGIAAQPTAWSASTISVPVPRGTKTGNVVVTASGLVSNGLAFTVQDDAMHIFATNCSTCGWQTTDFTIQTSPVYGYAIRSGDILYFYQWQSVGSVAGLEVCFPGGEGVSCADDGLTVDQDGKPVHADTITGATHFRRVDLSRNAGQTLSQISFHSHGTTKAGRWDVYFSNIQIVSTDGTVRSIFVTGSTPTLFMSSSFGVTGQGSAIEHAHVW